MTTIPIGELPVYEADAFAQADLQLLQLCRNLLESRNVRAQLLAEGRGVARIANLLQWQREQALEYLDGEGVYADQIVHMGLHHAVDHFMVEPSPRQMLFSEVVASTSDLYLLGCLSQAGLETDFLAETLESFGSYYEQYAYDPDQLEQLLTQLSGQPYHTMVRAAEFLYAFCEPLLYQPMDASRLEQMEARGRDLFYPLVHHYNISNWVLTIRGRFPADTGPRQVPEQVWRGFLGGETGLLKSLQQLVA